MLVDVLRKHTRPVARPWATLEIYDAGDMPHLDPEYEKDLFEGVSAQPWPEKMVSWVCGAHQGLWTTFLATLRPNGLVVSFEPFTDNLLCLMGNLTGRRLNNVLVAPFAVGDWDGEGHLYTTSGKRPTSPWLSLNEPKENGVGKAAVRRLDSLASLGLPPPDFIKANVECSEYEMVRGAEKLIRERRPRMLMDMHDGGLDLAIREFLGGLGYETTHWEQKIPSVGHHGRALWCVPKARYGLVEL